MKDLKLCQNPRNKSQGCLKWLPRSEFGYITRTKLTSLCNKCNLKKITDNGCHERAQLMQLTESVRKANGRTTQRGNGEKLQIQEVISKWTARCALCQQSIQLMCEQTEPKRAVIDRINTENPSYVNNFQWLCLLCNARKREHSFTQHFIRPVPNHRFGQGHGKPLKTVLFSGWVIVLRLQCHCVLSYVRRRDQFYAVCKPTS